MLDQLIELGKSHLGGQLQQSAGLTPVQVDKTMDVAKDSISETLMQQALGGNLGGILDLFNGKSQATTANPIVNQMAGNFASSIAEKLGVSPATAQMVTNMVIPFLMQKFASKETGTADDGNDLMEKFGLGNLGGLGGMLGGLSKLF